MSASGIGAGFGQNTNSNSFTLHNPPKRKPDPDEPFDPWGGDLPPTHPDITTLRMKKLGITGPNKIFWTNDGFDLSMAPWKQVTMNSRNPLHDLYRCSAERCNELNAFRSAEFSGPQGEGQIDDNMLKTALVELTTPVVTSWEEMFAKLDDINGRNYGNGTTPLPFLKKYLLSALNAQWGIDASGIFNNMHVLSESDSVANWADVFGNFEVDRVIDTLKAAIFYSGMDYKIDNIKDKFSLDLRYNDNSGAQQTITLVEGHVSADHAPGSHPHTEFKLGSGIPKEHRDRALIAMADMIAKHKQSNNSNVAEINMNGCSPRDMLRLVELLLFHHHMHLDLKDVKMPMIAALKQQEPYKSDQAFHERWEILSKYAKVFAPANVDENRINLDAINATGQKYSLYKKATGIFEGLPPHPNAPAEKWRPTREDLAEAMRMYTAGPSPVFTAAATITATPPTGGVGGPSMALRRH